jgi:predicted peroxiredoxin
MAKYLLIASRDPFSSNEVGHYYDLATNLVKDGNEVTLFLVQNGVLPARRSPASDAIAQTASAGVTVLADSFSLRERGIGTDRLVDGVKTAELDVVIDQLADGVKTLWN